MVNRRQLLKALGLGALSTTLISRRTASGDGPSFPSRIVFFIQPHAHIPNAWNMPMPGATTTSFAERSLIGLTSGEFSPALRPLHPFRNHLLAIDKPAGDRFTAPAPGGSIAANSSGVSGRWSRSA